MSSSRCLGYLVPSYNNQGSMDDMNTSVAETGEHYLPSDEYEHQPHQRLQPIDFITYVPATPIPIT